MNLSKTPLNDVVIIDIEARSDERGFFARTFCESEFLEKGTPFKVEQTSISFNLAAHTLRGMHYQETTYPETKLVRCTAGEIYDVAVDLRIGSSTYGRWFGTELTAANHKALYIPPGCAHGFITLSANSEVLYLMNGKYEPRAARGVRWDDPAFGIIWPATPKVMAERDATYSDFRLRE